MMKHIYVLGISAYYHNSSATLVKDGEIVAAAEEERFTRIKGDASFPVNAITFCLEKEKLSMADVSKVVYYENSAEKFGRIITNSLVTAPEGISQYINSLSSWISEKLWINRHIQKELNIKNDRFMYISHHMSHAASAFYPSPFEKAAVLTIDGVGEWASMSWGVCEGEKIGLMKELRFPNSLGLLYSAFTTYLGFRINSGEYKMMGLAPYGSPVYADLIKKELVKTGEDGSIVMNQKYFSYTTKMCTINKNFEKLFGKPRRTPKSEITEFHADVAASIQAVTDEIILTIAKHIRKVTKMNNLVLAGGVALNVTSMGKLRESKIFDNIWIQPASGDAGGSLGAALYGYYSISSDKRICNNEDLMKGTFLGYKIENQSAVDDAELKKLGGVWQSYSDSKLQDKIADLINDGKTVAIARGEAEFGPRALGNRSVLADARNGDMLQRLNMKVKFREGFRPFAPAVTEEDADKYFDMQGKSPYMSYVFKVKADRRKDAEKGKTIEETASKIRSDLPAVTHVDYSARVQTVSRDTAPLFYGVLNCFKKKYGCCVLVNTSFNVRGEPIVNTAADAYRCFMNSGIDYAVIGNRLFDKSRQDGRHNEEN